MSRRRICYVTGTRAEFGLMRTALDAIRTHPKLELRLIATGMHLSAAHGRTINQIRAGGFGVDTAVAWREASTPIELAIAMSEAQTKLARAIANLDPEIVLVCGDRVEAFAAASAAHVGGRIVAHVHGGDRALGLVDDALRHAITKLAHIHLPATAKSAQRIYQLGEDRFRIHRVGTPGLDGIKRAADTSARDDLGGLILLHPDSPDDRSQRQRMRLLILAALNACKGEVLAMYPNNDPGWRGIVDAIEERGATSRLQVVTALPRELFLGLLAKTPVLIGNSSAGIIEAASLGTPVVNVGDRQLGRERSANVVDVPWDQNGIERAIIGASRRRYRGTNVYGGGNAGVRIARVLSDVVLDEKMRKKLIRY